jgi:hypothetical protein
MWKEKLEEEAFVVSSKSCGFTKIISYLHSLVDAWNPDVTLEMNLKQPELLWYGIREEYLRLRIEKYFLPQLEKYCNKSKIYCNILLRTKIILFLIFIRKYAHFKIRISLNIFEYIYLKPIYSHPRAFYNHLRASSVL